MKKILCSALLAGSLTMVHSNALSADSGPYIGVQIGESISDLKYTLEPVKKPKKTTTEEYTKNYGTAGRFYLGYMINRSVGIEAGYTDYSKSESTTIRTKKKKSTETEVKNDITSVDAMAFYRFRVIDKISFDVKGGFALVNSEHGVTERFYNSKKPDKNTVEKFGNKKSKSIRPKFGAVANYHVNDHVALQVVYELIPGRGKAFKHNKGVDSKYSPNIEMVSFGAAYAF